MAKRSILSEDDSVEIDLSPMIDCVFILLIFFIVTTVFVEEKGLQVNKPDAAAELSQDEKDRVTLEITAQSQVLMDGNEVDLGEVTARVRADMHDADTPVVIRAHEKSHHGVFVAVWDAAKRGGAKELSFTTVN